MRKTFAVGVFYIYLTAASVLIEVTGVASAWGVDSPTGFTNAVSKVESRFGEIDPSGGLGDTLFGTFTAVASIIETLGTLAFALPNFMRSMGIPDPFVAFLMAPMFLLVGRGIIHALTGRFA